MADGFVDRRPRNAAGELVADGQPREASGEPMSFRATQKMVSHHQYRTEIFRRRAEERDRQAEEDRRQAEENQRQVDYWEDLLSKELNMADTDEEV